MSWSGGPPNIRWTVRRVWVSGATATSFRLTLKSPKPDLLRLPRKSRLRDQIFRLSLTICGSRILLHAQQVVIRCGCRACALHALNTIISGEDDESSSQGAASARCGQQYSHAA